MVARKDVTGTVVFAPDGQVVRDSVEDSFSYVPLTPYVHAAVVNRARRYLTTAARSARSVLAGHPVR